MKKRFTISSGNQPNWLAYKVTKDFMSKEARAKKMTASLHPMLDDKETTPVYILKSHLQLAHQLHLLSNGCVQYLK